MKQRILAVGFAILAAGFCNQPPIQAVSMFHLVVVYSTENTGQGIVTVDRASLQPDGIEDGGPADCIGAVCGATYLAGTRVTLTAMAAPGSEFTGWGGECSGTSPTCVLRMDSHRDVIVYFGN